MSLSAVLQNEQPWHIEQIDVFAGCRLLPAKSIHAICSSPPYLGLRDYGIPPREWSDGLVCCYGLEPDVASYVRHAVELFEEFRRVLRDDGVIWWNIGDSYSSGGRKTRHVSGLHGRCGESANVRPGPGAEGQKLLIPHRVAIALADAGWIVRQDNVWAKKSPMPESISGWRWRRCRVKRKAASMHDSGKNGDHIDRRKVGFNDRWDDPENHASKWAPCPGCKKCEPHGGYVLRRGSWRNTNAHEYIFQIVKSGEYFGDGDAASEETTGGAHHRGTGVNPKCEEGQVGVDKQNASMSAACNNLVESRNPRSVWHLSSESYKGAHFATFPSELARRCLVPSLSAGGCCPQCGSQYAPRVRSERVPTRPGNDSKVGRVSDDADSPYHQQNGAVVGNRDPQRHIAVTKADGYLPTCRCLLTPDSCLLPPLVLEPFTGSGTTIQVAAHLGFRAIGFEVNPQYIELAKERIGKVPRCLVNKGAKRGSRKAESRLANQREFMF